jgi:nicotinamidase/pyrazinamidase
MIEDASAGIDVPVAGLWQTKAKEEGVGLGIRYMTSAEFNSSIVLS